MIGSFASADSKAHNSAAEHLVLGDFRVKLRDNALTAEGWAEPLVPKRHLPSHEVKAVTYHALTVQQGDNGYLAEVVLDI